MRRGVAMPIVVMCFAIIMMVIGMDANNIDCGEAHPTLHPDGIGKRADAGGRPFQDHGFKRRRMIEDHVRRRNDKIVMFVLHVEQSLRQRARPMVVDIREVRDTVIADSAIDTLRFHHGTDEVANGFRPALIALIADYAIKERRDFRVE